MYLCEPLVQPDRAIPSGQIIDLIKGLPDDSLGVEELHGDLYWVHAWSEEKYLVEIGAESPAYNALREYHPGALIDCRARQSAPDSAGGARHDRDRSAQLRHLFHVNTIR